MDFWDLYYEYYEKIGRFIFSIVKNSADVEDVVQETFLKISQKSDTLREPEKISAWIFQVAYRTCLDHLRRIETRPSAAEFDVETVPDCGTATDLEYERYQMSDCVHKKMMMLPTPAREIIVLCELLGFSHAEAAVILGIEPGAARVRLHRAKQKLKEILSDECEFSVDERNVLVCDPRRKNVG